ncbi:MAG: Gfo/Idh/MocA family oxidoreductase [Caldilineaceae bacterium SB0668_bin_21]|nr:Gfo/Idh/MocA family oxidoreductase [Caldilineaceae bacterium SB0668_bin_21]MYC22149.1 Gfo/Idh/MocA family oxidoreductase [Caldilineaceae bacterium SB0662_bin_25]
MEGKLTCGLIGLSQGWYADLFATELLAMKDVELVGVCDLGKSRAYVEECIGMGAEEFAAKFEATLYHDAADLLGQKLDFVVVASEIGEHCENSCQALEAGANVFACKPFSFISDEVRRAREVAQRNSRIVMPAVPSRFEDGLIEAVRRVRAGDIGRPLTARVFVNHVAMTNPEWQRDPAKSGGPLGEFGTYGFDIVRWALGGEPEEVFAYGENFVHKGVIEGWDNVKALVRFDNGSLGSVHVCTSISWEYPFFDLEVVGEKGCVRTDYHNYPVVTHGTSSARLAPIRYAPMNQSEIAHFVMAVRGEEALRVTLDDAYAVARTIEAVQESLTAHRPVRIEL